MRRLMFQSLSTIGVAVSLFIANPVYLTAQADVFEQSRAVVRRPIPRGAPNQTLHFARTELFFGTAKPDGVVTEEEFLAFLDAEITPRFPDGLTLLRGDGQFSGEDGVIVKEQSFVLILFSPWKASGRATGRSTSSVDSTRRCFNRSLCSASTIRSRFESRSDATLAIHAPAGVEHSVHGDAAVRA